ncbi:hypothetical protein G8O24_27865 [Bradyrhizobium sp. INPA01-394B]|uniref:DUF3606 domain-containing protein n=1 Tax=Bradyrhizobium campsiandrae TaxID=1729892 RepID=A0ABR7U7P5_9BRAD|nr:hypothetical protein [Bradyrhizobium campsiandrae]MBC9881151.1 hypothetical protein [Bradyrhizobium campsiandrae]MBC9980005.1 hypothetical protein [Bradyrhizobium campsiandrae]
MGKDGEAAHESAAVPKEEMLAPDHGKREVETNRSDRTLKNALEDDEVREALKLHRQRLGNGL